MPKSETSKSIIYRSEVPESGSFVDGLVDHLTAIVTGDVPGLHTTQIYDKESGQWGEGSGNTQAEADQTARDDLADKKG